MSKIAIKPFIDALEKFDLNEEVPTFHLSSQSYAKLKIIQNKISSILENYEVKGWLCEKEHKDLKDVYKSIEMVKKQDDKSNGDT